MTTKRTSYLKNYDKLRKGKHLQKYWSNSALIAEKKFSTIGVEPIDIGRISSKKGVTAENCREWLRSALEKALGGMGTHFVFGKGPDVGQAKLAIAITEMTPGSNAVRILVGELGMGHAHVKVEGRIVDSESNEEVAAFSEGRHSSGAIGLRDVRGDQGPLLVREMLEQIAVHVMLELKESFGF